MKTITRRQREVLSYIYTHALTHFYQPDMREIATHFKWKSSNAAFKHIEALEKKGFIKKVSNEARAIRFTPKGLRELGVKTPVARTE